MAYAAYRYPPGSSPALAGETHQVLSLRIPILDCYRFRKRILELRDIGIVRCEPLAGTRAACQDDAPRAVLHIRFPASEYLRLIDCILACVQDGEVGSLKNWDAYLRQRGIANGG